MPLHLCHSTKRKFGDERFHYFMFLVAMQCIINAMFARLGKVLKLCVCVWEGGYYLEFTATQKGTISIGSSPGVFRPQTSNTKKRG